MTFHSICLHGIYEEYDITGWYWRTNSKNFGGSFVMSTQTASVCFEVSVCILGSGQTGLSTWRVTRDHFPKQTYHVIIKCNNEANVGGFFMMTSSNGNIFPRHWPFVRGIHRSPVDSPQKASDAELWCFVWSTPEQTVEQTIGTPVIWDAIALIMTLL